MAKDDKAVAVVNPLQAALEKTIGSVLTPADYADGQYEAPQLVYLQVRQKDLKDEKGKLARSAGGIRAGSIREPDGDDRSELTVTVLAFKPSRVYFASLNDPKPACKSDDMVNGSAQRSILNGRAVYGRCQDCWFAQWGSAEGGRQACRESRKVLVMDWEKERPAVLTLGPSSIKPFKAWSTTIKDQARKFADKQGRVPVIFHLLRTQVVPEYVAEPAGHYVLKWGAPEALPLEVQEMMARLRAESASMFAKAAERDEEAEDYVGPDAAGEASGQPVGSAPGDGDALPF